MADRAIARMIALLPLTLGFVLASWTLPHGKKSDWHAPEEANKLKNPVPADKASLTAAKSIYLEKCAQCHGEGGKGDGPEAPMYSVQPADFTDAHMMGEMTEGEIFWKISEGRKPMPAFKLQLSEEQRWQLVNYVRTFARKPAHAVKSAAAPATKKSTPHKQ